MPTCPFAGPELDSGRLMIDAVCPGGTTLIELVRQFLDSDHNSALFAIVTEEQITPRETRQYQKFVLKLLEEEGTNDYRVVCFNPNDIVTVVQGYNPRALAPYFLINIANKHELWAAHETLEKSKYFHKLSESYLKYLGVEPKSLNKSECASSKKRT